MSGYIRGNIKIRRVIKKLKFTTHTQIYMHKRTKTSFGQ